MIGGCALRDEDIKHRCSRHIPQVEPLYYIYHTFFVSSYNSDSKVAFSLTASCLATKINYFERYDSCFKEVMLSALSANSKDIKSIKSNVSSYFNIIKNNSFPLENIKS